MMREIFACKEDTSQRRLLEIRHYQGQAIIL